jgi:hypothetical protein
MQNSLFNELSDKQLLNTYLQGFNSVISPEKELKKKPLISWITNPLLKRAFDLGRVDAVVGDDTMSLNYRTDEEILSVIKNEKIEDIVSNIPFDKSTTVNGKIVSVSKYEPIIVID